MNKGIRTVFPGAVHIQCALHKRDNIKEKLRHLGVKEDTARQIMNDIFGHHIFSTYYSELIDAKEVREFNSKIEILKAI